jgi:hypothetical protein
VPPKNDIGFWKIFSWENILDKSPFMRKEKKGEKGNAPLFFAPNYPTPPKK